MAAEEMGVGVKWRAVASPAIGVIWLILVLLWWAFWSDPWTVAQRTAIVIMSLLVVGALMGAIWIPWSMRYAPPKDRAVWSQRGFTPRVAVSMAVILGAMVLLSYWLFLPGKDYDICQTAVVIVVVFLACGLVMGPMWALWGRDQARTAVDGVAREVRDDVLHAVAEAEMQVERAMDHVLVDDVLGEDEEGGPDEVPGAEERTR